MCPNQDDWQPAVDLRNYNFLTKFLHFLMAEVTGKRDAVEVNVIRCCRMCCRSLLTLPHCTDVDSVVGTVAGKDTDQTVSMFMALN